MAGLMGLAISLQGQSDPSNQRLAVITAVEGEVYYSAAGVEKAPVRRGLTLAQGAKVWTERGTVELFFRQIGSMTKLMPQSELSLEKLDKRPTNGVVAKETVLSLTKGRVLARARVLLPESMYQIRTPKTTFVVPEIGSGRFDIRADGTALVGIRSKIPLGIYAEGKTNLISPGQMVEGPGPVKLKAVDAKTLEELKPQFDELEALAELLAAPPDVPKKP